MSNPNQSPRANKAMSLTTNGNRRRGAGRCIEAASMGVTVAVEAARERGYMSTSDARHLKRAERRQYVRLCEIEWGVTEWVQGESPDALRQAASFDDMSQFDNVSNLFGSAEDKAA